MRFIFVAVAAVVSVFMMFIIAKIVGYRQISEISMFDYINSITLGSIAAELAISPNLEKAVYCLIGMTIFGLFTLIFALLSMKYKSARRILVGEPIVLMEKGKMYRNSFSKARLDLEEFLSMCRVSGYSDPTKLDTVIMEPTGKISVIPKSGDRPLTPKDMKIPVEQEGLIPDVIKDGKISNGNLRRSGFDERWLDTQLKGLGVKSNDVFLGVIDSNNKLQIFEFENNQSDNPL